MTTPPKVPDLTDVGGQHAGKVVPFPAPASDPPVIRGVKPQAEQPGDWLVRAAMTGADFVALDLPRRPSLLGNGVISAGTYALMFGKPGTGKTSLVLHLGAAVSSGKAWFGLPTEPGGARVGVLELELTPELLQDRLRRIAGDDAAALNNISVIVRPNLTGVLDLSKEQDLGALRTWIERERLALVIVDALGRAHSLDQNSIGPLLNALDPVLRETGCALLLIHHDRKAGTDPGRAGDDLDEARGDSRLVGDAATVVRVVRHGNFRELRFVKTWSGPEPEPIWVTFDDNGSLVQVEAPQKKAGRSRDRVSAALPELGQPATVSEIREHLANTLSDDIIYRRLRELENEGKVVRIARTGRSGAIRWAISDPDAPHAPHAPQNNAAQRRIDWDENG